MFNGASLKKIGDFEFPWSIVAYKNSLLKNLAKIRETNDCSNFRQFDENSVKVAMNFFPRDALIHLKSIAKSLGKNAIANFTKKTGVAMEFFPRVVAMFFCN